MERAPAALATHAHEACSARYGFIDTERVINYLAEEGYQVRDIRAGTKGRTREFGMHTVRLIKDFKDFDLGGVFPELVFTNSHDRTSGAVMDLGLYRVECNNGLVVGLRSSLTAAVTHVGDQRQNVLNAAQEVVKSIPRLSEAVNSWGGRNLTTAEIHEFGRRAFALRDGVGEEQGLSTHARRAADSGNDLWTVYNRTQENLFRGGFTVMTKGGHRRAKPIRAVRPSLTLNRQMWDLADEFMAN